MMEAFRLLLLQGRELDLRWINTLLREGRTMPSVQSALRSPELLAEQEYVTRSWELAHASVLAELKGRQEGRQEGQEEGTLKGEREAIRLVLKARFSFVPPDLEPELGKVSSLEALNELITAAATRTVPEVVQLAQRLARPMPSSP
jgi:hypothetical protein